MIADQRTRYRAAVFEGMGYWPMLEDPARFYGMLAEDIVTFGT